MAELQARIKSKIFEKGSFAIFRLDSGDSIAGNVPAMKPEHLVGAQVNLVGEWETNKHGKTFKFTSLMLNEDRVVHFLHKMVGYITKKTAIAINKKFGEEGTWKVLNETPELLLEFSGIGPKKLEKIKASWEEVKPMWLLGQLLSPLGVSNRQIELIHDQFGHHALAILEQDPYSVVSVHGIGFRIADEIALKVGVPIDSPLRLKACARYAVREEMNNTGNTALVPSAVIDRMMACLADSISQESDREKYYQALLDGLMEKNIRFILDPRERTIERLKADDFIADFSTFRQEAIIMRAMGNTGLRGPIVNNIDQWISKYESNLSNPLGDQQKDAIRLANQLPGIFSISGYAGTGKTTTSKAILTLLSEKFGADSIACCALAGVAANRIKMQSGYESSTIHSLLGSDGEGGFGYNEENKLPHSVVLLDESSMNDSWLLSTLFKAIDFERTTLIMLGDPAQLSPVGPGQPYADMLKLNLIPNVTLTKIYRTGDDMVIPVLAEAVRNGRMPDLKGAYQDFEYSNISIDGYMQKRRTLPKEKMAELRDANNLRIRERSLEIAREQRNDMREKLRNGDVWGYISHLQVISPMRKGNIGVTDLNRNLQDVMNPVTASLEIYKSEFSEFRVNDKVVHLKNKEMETFPRHVYKKFRDGKDIDDEKQKIKVFNGQQGLVIGATDEEVHVYYPIENYVCAYDTKHLSSNMLELSYCLTTHKTQGSEYNFVVLPISLSHYNMLSPKMLYTGMTRAKERLDIVGQIEAIEASCSSRTQKEKLTCIQVLAASFRPSMRPVDKSSGRSAPRLS